MAKIRSDLVGVVVVGGEIYRAGDDAPGIGPHLAEPETERRRAAREPEVKDGAAPKSSSRAKKAAPKEA